MASVANKSGPWRPEEDHLLASWQAKLGNKWAQIAQHIPGRTGQQCAQRWRHKVNPGIIHQPWTSAEDALLASLVESTGQHWAAIARHLPGRTDQQCLGRWRRHLDPSIFRGGWTAEEDALILQLHSQLGNAWSQIAKRIPSRTSHQCRGRFFQLQNKALVSGKKTKASRRSSSASASAKHVDCGDASSGGSDASDTDDDAEADTHTVVGGAGAAALPGSKTKTPAATTSTQPSSAHVASDGSRRDVRQLHEPRPADTLVTQCAPSKASRMMADTHQASSRKVQAADRGLAHRSVSHQRYSLAHLSGSERSERTKVPLAAVATPCNALQPPLARHYLPSTAHHTSLAAGSLEVSGAAATTGLLATAERRPSTTRKRTAVRRPRCTPLLFRTIGRRSATPPADLHTELACIPLKLDEEAMHGLPSHTQHTGSCLTGRSKGSCAELADDLPTASVAGPASWVPNPLPASSLIKRKSIHSTFDLADALGEPDEAEEEEGEPTPCTPLTAAAAPPPPPPTPAAPG